ncbi:lipocalin family protein [Larkinella rosea]|uniref:Lipocalin-like domain-containing protein n=1 Tax=Larkinella rosea TaxID=2025312 RepID=A0A3P1BYY8_9BACT|nr:lipocalin family protein [Larkinella rosea]RRB06321.1 hypothetical protein EHT25_00505 [Larkinella rosea]
MKMKQYLLVTGLVITTMFGCSKSKDSVTPDNTTDLLVRKWSITELSVKTDAKTYAIPSVEGGTFFGDDNTVTFNRDNTYSVVDGGKSATGGTWKLSGDNKTLSLTDVDKVTTPFTVNTLTSTTIELATKSVDMLKANPTEEEQSISFAALLLLFTIDKDNGGTVDFSKEPDPKTVQLVLKGKGM